MAKLISEAHLPAAGRSLELVGYLRRRRRSRAGLAIFVGLIALNELRGAAVAAEVLKALLS